MGEDLNAIEVLPECDSSPLKKGQDLTLGSLRAGTSRRLRLAGETDPQEREDVLNDLGDLRDFANEGDISARLLSCLLFLSEDEARVKLEAIYHKVAAPLHFRPLLPTLIAELEERRLSGEGWKDITDGVKLEVPLEGYAVTVVDACAFTPCLLEGEFNDKLLTATDLSNAFNELAQKTGVALLEPVVGDAGKFLSFSLEQQGKLEAELKRLRIPMKIEKLKNRVYPNWSSKYPIDPATQKPSFDLRSGVCPWKAGLKVLAYTGKEKKTGGVIVKGAAIEEAENLQKAANPGEILSAGSFGEPVGSSEWREPLVLPRSNLILVKVIEALLRMSTYSEAALADLLEGKEVEHTTPRLEAYYAVLSLEEGDVEAFLDQLFSQGTGTDNIVSFKPVGARELHFWSKNIQTPEQFQAAFALFVRQIKKMAKEAGCSIKLGLGYEQALDLLRLPGSFQVDATGAVIVGTVRAVAALHGRDGDYINVDSTACAALGLRGVEMTTHYIKGAPYRGVHLSVEEDGRLTLPEPLVGREKEHAALHNFVDRLGSNGVALKVQKSNHAVEGGYGESALLRATELYARNEKQFTENQVVTLDSEKGLFGDLEAKLGCSVDELMEHPDLLIQPVLLLWDADTVSYADAARMDRFLFAMAGAPIGLVYCGAYQFRPGAMTGDHYEGRELSAVLELEPLGENEALELVFQTRTDLNESHKARVRQLLKSWKGPMTPRLLIHNFSPALVVIGASCTLDSALLDQVWTGELAHILDTAGLDENDRIVLGILAEIGFPISLVNLQKLFSHLPWFACLRKLKHLGFLRIIKQGEEECFVPADVKIRKARLLARQYAPDIRKYLMENNFFRSEVDGFGGNEERSTIELEHALGTLETCEDPKTFDLVFRLGRLYLNEKKDFGAAYELYHRFLQTCRTHHVDLKKIPQELVHDLVWVLTQTKDKKDASYARDLLSAQKVLSPELSWRAGVALPKLSLTAELAALPSGHPYAGIMDELAAVSGDLEALGISRHRELENVLKLEALFVENGRTSQCEHPSVELLPLAFSGAALSRIAYASRLFARLARELAGKMPEETGLIASLNSAAEKSVLSANSRLSALKAELVLVDVSTPLDQELRAEILRCLLDTYKYLSSTPGSEDMKQIRVYHDKAARSFAVLDRPVHAASLDAFDVYCNAVALHWQYKLPLPGVFQREIEATAGGEDRALVWTTLQEQEDQIRTQWGLSVRDALLPLRYRLTLQLMNFIQLKMRLIARTFTTGDKSLFDGLHTEYEALVHDSARLHQFLEQTQQPDYYGLECLPIKQAVDGMVPVS